PPHISVMGQSLGKIHLDKPGHRGRLMTQSGRLKGWGCGKITRPEIAAMPQLAISWQRLDSASELRNLTATMGSCRAKNDCHSRLRSFLRGRAFYVGRAHP